MTMVDGDDHFLLLSATSSPVSHSAGISAESFSAVSPTIVFTVFWNSIRISWAAAAAESKQARRERKMYYQLFIINRSGGLIYSKSLSLQSPNLTTNDCLILGSTFHGLYSIATQIAPVVSAGIERLETDTFILQCLQTLTGTKFVITASPGTSELDALLLGIYEIYSDYVLKVFHSCLFCLQNSDLLIFPH